MKIIIVNNFFSPTGGAENSVYRTGCVLKQNGHDVIFFAVDKKPYFEENYEYSDYFPKYIEFSALKGAELLKYTLNPTYFYNFEAENKLGKLLDRVKPDLVHLNCINYYISPSVIKACQKRNIPTVMTIRDAFLACPDVGLMYKSETYCHNPPCASGSSIHCLINKCNDKSLIKSAISSMDFTFRKFHKLYNQVSKYICPSLAVVELAIKSGIKEKKLIHIPNFISDSFFEKEPIYTNQGYFLYAGRLVKEKGVHYLIEAMKSLPHIKLYIVGTGLEEANLKKSAENISNISFLGFKEGKELENLYRNCIATILPCNYFEAFGLTNVESFAYGKPVIASRIGGIPEIVDNGVNGITFEPGNINQLKSAILKLHANPELAVRMGQNGRNKAERIYSAKTHYEKLIQAYHSINIVN